jgi:hypothetical protein
MRCCRTTARRSRSMTILRSPPSSWSRPSRPMRTVWSLPCGRRYVEPGPVRTPPIHPAFDADQVKWFSEQSLVCRAAESDEIAPSSTVFAGNRLSSLRTGHSLVRAGGEIHHGKSAR